jgi:hypothetical protein
MKRKVGEVFEGVFKRKFSTTEYFNNSSVLVVDTLLRMVVLIEDERRRDNMYIIMEHIEHLVSRKYGKISFKEEYILQIRYVLLCIHLGDVNRAEAFLRDLDCVSYGLWRHDFDILVFRSLLGYAVLHLMNDSRSAIDEFQSALWLARKLDLQGETTQIIDLLAHNIEVLNSNGNSAVAIPIPIEVCVFYISDSDMCNLVQEAFKMNRQSRLLSKLSYKSGFRAMLKTALGIYASIPYPIMGKDHWHVEFYDIYVGMENMSFENLIADPDFIEANYPVVVNRDTMKFHWHE